MHDEKNNWYQKHYNVKRTIILKQNSRKLWNFATFTGDCFLKGEEQKQNFAQQKKESEGKKLQKGETAKSVHHRFQGYDDPLTRLAISYVTRRSFTPVVSGPKREREREREREKERQKGTRFSFSFSTVVFVYQEFYRL